MRQLSYNLSIIAQSSNDSTSTSTCNIFTNRSTATAYENALITKRRQSLMLTHGNVKNKRRFQHQKCINLTWYER